MLRCSFASFIKVARVRSARGLVGEGELRDPLTQRIVRIWGLEQDTDRLKGLWNCERRIPGIHQDVKAKLARVAYVAMVDWRLESDHRWLQWVLHRDDDVQQEDTALEGSAGWTLHEHS